MDGYVTLLGAETVERAAHSIHSSAETMRCAATTIYDAANRLQQVLDDHATRIERAVEQLTDALKAVDR
jgi:HPt (histidine-containing phosphotransfer) domain-containing protein